MGKRPSRSVIVLLILAILMAANSITCFWAGSNDPFSDIEKKLTGISDEEKQVLRNLFELTQEIKGLEGQGKELQQDMETMKADIAGLQTAIANEEKAYQKKRDTLKAILKSYQRMGAGSYIEILLDSDSLPSFLRRLNTLRDLTRNTGSLMNTLDESKQKLQHQKEALAAKLTEVSTRKQKLEQVLSKRMKLKGELEARLKALKEKKGYFAQRLADVEAGWNQVMAKFPQLSEDFSDILEKGIYREDLLITTVSFPGVAETMKENVLNSVIAENKDLLNMKCRFKKDHVDIEMLNGNFVLTGQFVVEDERAVRFEVESGTFFEMPIEEGTLKELLKDDPFKLDLGPYLNGYKLTSVNVDDGYMIMLFMPVIWK